VTRVGVLELRVPQDRAGRFSTELFDRYQHKDYALREMPHEVSCLRAERRRGDKYSLGGPKANEAPDECLHIGATHSVGLSGILCARP
jgi:hypothetical protein